MSNPVYNVRSEYIGDGSLAEYTFDFKITSLSQLLIIVYDSSFAETFRVDGNDTTYIDSVSYDPTVNGGSVTFVTAPDSGDHIAIIYVNDEPLQESEFKNKSDFTLKRFEDALDAQNLAIQRLAYLVKRSIKIDDLFLDSDTFNPKIPIDTTNSSIQNNIGRYLIVGADGASFALTETSASLAANSALYVRIAGTESITGIKTFTNVFKGATSTDSTTTGAIAALPAPATMALRVTNPSLTSIGTITGPYDSQFFVLINKTGATYTLKNDYGSGTSSILTGTSSDMTVANNATVWLFYDPTASRWCVVGGSGGGSSNTITDNLTLTNSAALTIGITAQTMLQTFRVQGNSAAVTLSTTPFGSSAPIDGSIIYLIGNDDTNTVSITATDAAKGCVGNFATLTLAKYETAGFMYSSSLDRYVLL